MGLPPIPMVPVSSSQVIIGCIIGIGLYKGARNINFRILAEIAAGWIATPIFSGILAFFSLFFIKNIFSIDVGGNDRNIIDPAAQSVMANPQISEIMQYLILSLLIAGTVAILFYYFLDRKKKIELRKSEEKFWRNLK